MSKIFNAGELSALDQLELEVIHYRGSGKGAEFLWKSMQAVAEVIEKPTASVLESCRDHWKTSFKHERQNVIRLRNIVFSCHQSGCICEDCRLVMHHIESKTPLVDISIAANEPSLQTVSKGKDRC